MLSGQLFHHLEFLGSGPLRKSKKYIKRPSLFKGFLYFCLPGDSYWLFKTMVMISWFEMFWRGKKAKMLAFHLSEFLVNGLIAVILVGKQQHVNKTYQLIWEVCTAILQAVLNWFIPSVDFQLKAFFSELKKKADRSTYSPFIIFCYCTQCWNSCRKNKQNVNKTNPFLQEECTATCVHYLR
jgi:hypothetical protein